MDTNTREQALQTGDVVDGRYKVIKPIGEGGMGTVYLAEHTLIRRRVAIKVLHSELAADATVVERFMNEARAAGTLGHANIVESTDMGFRDKVPYIVFEYLEGAVLTDEIYRVSGMPVRRAVRVAQQVASALQAAHAAGIVHRDLKSDNIILTDRNGSLDHVKVLDFGISKFLETKDERTRRGMIMGTPEFMAPEQISDPDHVDGRVDIYALGVILYEMLAGRRPFKNDDPRTLLHRILHSDPPMIERADVPRGLLDLVFRLMSKNPDDRFQTMADVEAVLDLYVTHADSSQLARRTSSMAIPVATVTDIDMTRPTTLSQTGAHVVSTVNTPYPAGQLNATWPAAAQSVLVGQPPPSRANFKMYAAVGAGLVMGAVGLFVGLNRDKPVAAAPAPAVAAAAIAPITAPIAQVPAEVQKVAVRVTSDIPGARVTFRRRVSPAPSSIEVAPTDIVELVEVSAPGHKTVRYWLTIDRMTELKANLPKGNGMIEASEEDILVALGEAQAINIVDSAPEKLSVAATVAPKAAAPEQAKINAVATATKVIPTPRKIGKGAEQPSEITTEVPVPTAAIAPDVAKPATGGLAARFESKGADVAAVAKPAEIKAQPVAQPVAKAEPKPQAIAQPVAPATQVPAAKVVAKTQGIDRGVLQSVVSSNRGAVMKCYQDARAKDASLKGAVSVSLSVDAAGKVVRPQVSSTLKGAPQVSACILKSASGWKFPARPGDSTASTSYTFNFN